ncbi:probable LRR receptor-like serine/threonine-protein kinase At3g47570 isoform X3 [Ipomoea triloba]|uniref:probable LRR receptor-like serine/threonine-protein kinase At3g47570 isoform X3 n=1 Tax=Ipomoea triloba TaxID=35885 RepID=UPI00125DC00A|nr:probable LRR receptor-like serine/threonine-protein kinase At3g47570 isoform X3 [Ipomoea triloba]
MAKTISLFSLFIIFIIHSTTNSSVECVKNISTDQSALIALKHEITIANPNNVLVHNWSTEISVCHWIGVTCGRHHHRVVALNISNMGLFGQLPASLGNLSFLSSVNLSHNNFTDEILPQLGNLRRLKVINLHLNHFVGSVPSSLFNISTLEIIDLTTNSFSGTLPSNICHNLPNLKGLYLDRNSFSGRIPANLSACSSLRVLGLETNLFNGFIPGEIGKLKMLARITLAANNLRGTIPQEISKLNELQVIAMRNNNLSGLIPKGIFNSTTLRIIELSVNHLWGSLPNSIGYGLPNLEGLYMFQNKLSGVIPQSIANCSRLSIISIANNYLSGSIPNSLGNLRFLRRFQVFANKLSSESSSSELSFITSLTKCRNLIILEVGENFFNGILPKSIGNFSSSLEKLVISHVGLRGTIPKEIGNLSGLEILGMSMNDLTGFVPHTLSGLQHLKRLFLFENKLRGPLPFSLCKLQKLGLMDLSQNQISGSIPECLGNHTFLRYIFLGSNRIIGRLPSSLWIMKDLLELNLSSNSLSGALSPDIGNLKVIINICLSKNQLSGSIPSTIGSLQSLILLSLAHNNLNGQIPKSIGGMLSLESLDLSHNNLSGSIPASMQEIRYLRNLNVSFNRLSGEIPSNGPFRNFTSLSFLFNEALCGDPRFGVPLCHKSVVQRSKAKRMLRYIFMALGIIVVMLAMMVGIVLIMFWRRKKVTKKEDLVPIVKEVERISYDELSCATNGFNERNVLGTGSFGVVYQGVLNDGTILAIKVFKMQEEGTFQSFNAECKILFNLRHRNLVKVQGYCSNPNFKALVLEYMPNGTFEEWLYSENHFLNITQRLNIMIDVACALEYLHYGYTTSVVHCDLKPSNILLDEDMVAHVADFGIAKLLGSDDSKAYTNTLATLGYIAPEYGFEGLVSTKCDIYSYGILLMETFTRTKPNSDMFSENVSLRSWVEDSLPDKVINICDIKLLTPNDKHFNEKVNCLSSIMELALKCSVDSPAERIGIREILATLHKIKYQFITYFNK